MNITLTYDEVRAALAKALNEKTNHMYGEFSPDDCWLTVTHNNGEEVLDVEEICFTGQTD
jgi:hypothetical protein